MKAAWKLAALATVGVLGIAASASADVRYAAPEGTGHPNECLQSDPCGLVDATANGDVTDGDEVVVLPGLYNLGNDILGINDAIDVHGAAGSRPTIAGDHDFGLVDVNTDGARLADLELDHNGEFFALIVDGQSVVERLVVRSPAADGACHVSASGNATVIRDTVCFNEGGGPGIQVQPDLFVETPTVTLRNVTAISSGPHPGILGTTPVDSGVNLDVLNSIASGGAGASDVVADEEGGASPTISIALRNSNYDTVSVPPGEPGTVTAPGTGTNQTAAPLLTNIDADFAQLPGSPTIDAGAPDASLGSLDLFGEARIQGPAPDIGADETATPPDVTPPDFQAKAKRKQKGPNVKVKVRCVNEPCAVVLRGKLASRDTGKLKLKTARTDLEAGERKTLKLKPKGKKAKRTATEALLDGVKLKAKIKAKATDAAGNTAKDKLKVTLAR